MIKYKCLSCNQDYSSIDEELKKWFTNTFKISNNDVILFILLLRKGTIPCGFLTNELRVTSYELRVTIYCLSCELLFTYELRVTIYYTSYELIFTYELRVTIYCTSYKLNLSYELRVTIYCTSWGCNVDYVKFLYDTSYSFRWSALYKIENSSSAIPEQCLNVWMLERWITISYSFMCKTSLHFCDLFLITRSIPS